MMYMFLPKLSEPRVHEHGTRSKHQAGASCISNGTYKRTLELARFLLVLCSLDRYPESSTCHMFNVLEIKPDTELVWTCPASRVQIFWSKDTEDGTPGDLENDLRVTIWT